MQLALLALLAAAFVAAAQGKEPRIMVRGAQLTGGGNYATLMAPFKGIEDCGAAGTLGWRKMAVRDNYDAATKVQQLRADGFDAEIDWPLEALKVPNDASWGRITTAMGRISAVAAWDKTTGSAGGPVVCIIDTGIIAGVGNNGQGVAGVGWSTKVLGCKFLSQDGSGYTSDAMECVKWCRDQGAKITSNSWGGGGFSQALADEISLSENAGHLFIAAAGNENCNLDGGCESYPASYTNGNIISVGAIDASNDQRASFSNYGRTNVDLFAPGVSIYSTVLGADYASYSGTSMACPHVAGAAALLWGYMPSLSAAQYYFPPGDYYWPPGNYYPGDYYSPGDYNPGDYYWPPGDYYPGDYPPGDYSGGGDYWWQRSSKGRAAEAAAAASTAVADTPAEAAPAPTAAVDAAAAEAATAPDAKTQRHRAAGAQQKKQTHSRRAPAPDADANAVNASLAEHSGVTHKGRHARADTHTDVDATGATPAEHERKGRRHARKHAREAAGAAAHEPDGEGQEPVPSKGAGITAEKRQSRHARRAAAEAAGAAGAAGATAQERQSRRARRAAAEAAGAADTQQQQQQQRHQHRKVLA
ncbi:hypothetical protein FOA52_007516 [Chlamydomonas sp. UWO 241]|nr:hypothetical protein FOA52_007516 [Chlamydomonas sp. UWO 241]